MPKFLPTWSVILRFSGSPPRRSNWTTPKRPALTGISTNPQRMPATTLSMISFSSMRMKSSPSSALVLFAIFACSCRNGCYGFLGHILIDFWPFCAICYSWRGRSLPRLDHERSFRWWFHLSREVAISNYAIGKPRILPSFLVFAVVIVTKPDHDNNSKIPYLDQRRRCG